MKRVPIKTANEKFKSIHPSVKIGIINFVRGAMITCISVSNICAFLPVATAMPSFLISAHLFSSFSEMDFSFNELKYSFQHYHQHNFSFSNSSIKINDSIPTYHLTNRYELDMSNLKNVSNRRLKDLELEPKIINADISLNTVHAFNAKDTSFTCVQLPSTYDPTTMCSGLVVYPFYLPQSANLSSLDILARKKAKGLISFINTACLADMKRLICASVYKQCVPNVVPKDVSTYSVVEAGVQLPFVRPCISLCVAVSFMGSTCGGIIEGLGLAVDCSAVDSDGTLIYDPNPLTCNNMAYSKAFPLVAEQFEPYIGSVCKGIISKVYLPDPSTVNALLAPLLPPYVLQSVSEAVLAGIESKIPRYLKSDCLAVQREIMCSMFFLAPHPSDAFFFPFQQTVYLPSFPRRDVCTRYSDKCASMIALLPSAAINCLTPAGPGIQMFPEHNQTILRIQVAPGVLVNITTPPHDTLSAVAASGFHVDSQCPYGLTIPEDLTKETIMWIPGTACAVPCPSPIYTDDEFRPIVEGLFYGSWLNVAVGFILFVNVYVLKPSKRNIFVVIQISALFVYNLMILMKSNFNVRDAALDVQICDSNASWFSYHTRNESTLSMWCTVSGLSTVIISFINYWCCLALAIEIWLRVVWNLKRVDHLRRYYFFGTMLIFIANEIVSILVGKPVVLIPGVPTQTCAYQDPDNYYWILFFPLSIYFLVALVLSAHAVYVCVATSWKVERQSAGAGKPQGPSYLSKLWSSYGMLIMFLGQYAIFFLPIIIFLAYIGKIASEDFANGSLDWFTCLLANFVDSGSTDSAHMKQVCGATPKVRPALGMYYLIMVLNYVWPVVILGITTSPGDVQSFYWNSTVSVLKLLRLDGLIRLNYKEVKQQLVRSSMVSSMSQYVGDEEDMQVVQAVVAVKTKPGCQGPSEGAVGNGGKGAEAGGDAGSRQEHKHLTGDVVVFLDSDGELEACESGPRGTVVLAEDDLCSVETFKSAQICAADRGALSDDD